MTKQLTHKEIFQRVYTHLNTQKRACYDISEGSCAYRHGKRKCAVGALIPDENYTSLLEGHSIESISQDTALFSEAFKGTGIPNRPSYVSLMQDLQEMHDYNLHSIGVKEWRRAMKEYAEDKKLGSFVW